MSVPSIRPALPALAAAALAAAAARPAAAQAPAAPSAAASRVVPAVVRPAVRHVAAYRFGAPHKAGLPAELSVVDSAGALVASYRLAGEGAARPLAVVVLGTDLVLQGEAPAGLLTIVLERQSDDAGAGAPVTGRWWLGGQQGTLRGRATEVAAAAW